MNVQQFAALKVGDKIENVYTHSVAEVTEVTDKGVRVRWGDVIGSPSFFYSVNSTAWFHWELPK